MRARVLLHQAAQLDDEMRRHASGSRGYVRVFANISSIVEFLPGALASFSAAHPDIHVQLEEHVSSAIAAAVADSSADFGIVSELPVIDGLTTVPFRNDELVRRAATGSSARAPAGVGLRRDRRSAVRRPACRQRLAPRADARGDRDRSHAELAHQRDELRCRVRDGRRRSRRRHRAARGDFAVHPLAVARVASR